MGLGSWRKRSQPTPPRGHPSQEGMFGLRFFFSKQSTSFKVYAIVQPLSPPRRGSGVGLGSWRKQSQPTPPKGHPSREGMFGLRFFFSKRSPFFKAYAIVQPLSPPGRGSGVGLGSWRQRSQPTPPRGHPSREGMFGLRFFLSKRSPFFKVYAIVQPLSPPRRGSGVGLGSWRQRSQPTPPRGHPSREGISWNHC
ncbi:hypothetical protein [Leptothoe sp. PORK10 BA2]|uniref:hypothetical protein n=1 Tax=Leptothoe sp. PORK10 BA2 TaxID=3110254 RepID=UPI002B1EF5E3|nr:hypothetical protein [Leptothoe sp. PORK10 BA2]MEA5464445.1 hypothetical protein [Leptothoe sp. PORK10 BA2]